MHADKGGSIGDKTLCNGNGAMTHEKTFGDAIAELRTGLGLTQAQFAHRLYVTRQCVSRWETGETQPGIDMVKLICVEFGTPIERFFNMPSGQCCQCCGMPLPASELHGTEADGSSSPDYCAWCYEGGEFSAGDISMDDFIETTAHQTAEALGATLDESVSLMGATLPLLKRWREKNRTRRHV